MPRKKWLFHATFSPLLSSIRKNGLGNTERTWWEDSKPGVVYLCEDREEALDFASCCVAAMEEFGLNVPIVLLQVDPTALDKSKIFPDANVTDSPKGFYEYHGTIPREGFTRVIKHSRAPQKKKQKSEEESS